MTQDTGVFSQVMARNPHLKGYVDRFTERTRKRPEFHIQLSQDMKDMEFPNVIYPAINPIFIHICRPEGGDISYTVIEPEHPSDELYDSVFNSLVLLANKEKEPEDTEEFKKLLNRLIGEICIVGEVEGGMIQKLASPHNRKIQLSQAQLEKIRYKVLKNMAGLGIMEPLLGDPNLEDIFCTGIGPIFVVHKIFGAMQSNMMMELDAELDEYCQTLAERIDKPLSDAKPIADGSLPGGARTNIIYSKAISRRGSSFSIRKFPVDPLSITRIVSWGTLSAEMAAYIWICLENGMSIFFCGESASGKTGLLNAACAFVKAKSKIYSCEDTLEVTVPHKCWQQLTTRGEGVKTEASVEMHDLLKAALRSRPNYIIVGEIRGAEGNVAFQAMQTGHPCMSTFHASSVRKMIQRFTGDPINVPLTFLDNLNVSVIMQAVYKEGALLRRVLELAEMEGYSSEADGILTRTMFSWDSSSDAHTFKGLYNSFILEDKIAVALGYEDPRKIYDDLLIRTRIIDEMISREIFDYFEVFDIVKKFSADGVDGLPFTLR